MVSMQNKEIEEGEVVPTITSGQWVAPEVVLLTNQRLLMTQPVALITLKGHR